MNETQVFLLFFLQNVLNFFLFFLFTQKYSEISNVLNGHLQNTTKMFLDHLSDMYYSYRSYEDDEEEEEEEAGEEEGEEDVSEEDNSTTGSSITNQTNESGSSSSSPYWDSDYEKESNLFQSG